MLLKKCAFYCCWIEGSVWVLCFFTYVLSVCFYHHWWRDVEVSNYYCRTSYVSFQFCQFVLYIFWWSANRCVNVYHHYIFLLYWIFYYYVISLSLVVFSDSKSILSDIGIATLFFWLTFVWNIFTFSFFHFNLFLPLYIKLISYREYLLGSCFFNPLTILSFWLGNLIHLHLK